MLRPLRAIDGGRRSHPLRILHLAAVINRHDFIDHVVRFCDRARFTMMACTLRAPTIESPRYEADGISHFVIPGPSRRSYARVTLRLARLLRRERIHLLHTHHFYEALIGVLAGRLAGTPAVILGQHYHDELYLTTSGAKLRTLLAIEGFCNRRARAIIVPSTDIRRLLVERQGVPAEKVVVVPYGFDFDVPRYRTPGVGEVKEIRTELGVSDEFLVGNFGRHHSLKGQDYLLDAFAALSVDHPRVRLLMVGDGPFHASLRALAERRGVSDRVIFTGWRSDALRLMSAVDAVVHPSLLDSFPQVMVEAMALAKPLIVTGAAGPSDQVRHGETGIVIPMRSAPAIVEALRWVIARPDDAVQLGERARLHVRRELNIRNVARLYEACYDGTS